jgi:hypothetical protein
MNYKVIADSVKNRKLIRKKVMISAFAVGLCMTANVMAQVPSYLPTNGLVGWWPFNGNANDESGNSIHGLVSNASLSADRFSNLNSAYSFYGNGDYIEIPTSIGQFDNQQYTISFWFRSNQGPSSVNGGPNVNPSIMSRLNIGGPTFNPPTAVDNFSIYEIGGSSHLNTPINGGATGSVTILGNIWKNIVYAVSSDSTITYVNGNRIASQINNGTINFQNYPIRLGRSKHTYWKDFSGELDDFGYWNRSLTECEIHNLYNAQLNSVSGTISVSPQIASIGSNVSLSTTSQSTNIQWQSNPSNFGWQNIPTNSNYSGGTTSALTVANVQLSNHNQPFRVIANAGNCTDTSSIATIQIADTCTTNVTDTTFVTITDTNVVTVYDTLLTTVTDTLIINTTLSLPAPNNENTILIYPNPASDHITIDNGNFSAMAGYSIKIENNAGQQVFQSLINQAQFYVDLSTWTGNGLYFVHLIDPQNNTVTVRKIVLQ